MLKNLWQSIKQRTLAEPVEDSPPEINNTSSLGSDLDNTPPSRLKLTQADYQDWITEQRLRLSAKHSAPPELTLKFLAIIVADGPNPALLQLTYQALLRQEYHNIEIAFLSASDTIDIEHGQHPVISALADINDADFMVVLEPGYVLAEHALSEVAHTLAATPECDFIYCDHDQITDDEVRHSPVFKPQFSPCLLQSTPYIGQLMAFKPHLLKHFDKLDNPEQLAALAFRAECVTHIPEILIHRHQASLQHSQKYWRRALETLGVNFTSAKNDVPQYAKVCVVIPFKDKPELLERCVNAVFTHSNYVNIDVLGISNKSELDASYEMMALLKMQYPKFRTLEYNHDFNFAALANFGVEHADADYVVLLNNDVEITSPDWLESLLEHAQHDDVGAVGAKLLFPDGRVQHAGIVTGMHGLAGHSQLYFDGDDPGYQNSLILSREVSAVTGAMMMFKRELYQTVGGMDEDNLAIAYNDVDLCLKFRDSGYRNIVTPHCRAIHQESASRGYEDTDEKRARLERERNFFIDRWQKVLEQPDPYFSPHFDLSHHNLKIRVSS